MERALRLSLATALAGLGLAAGVAAQTAPPAAGSPVLAPRQEDRPASSAPRRSRAISGEAAAALAAAAPKYTPPPPPPPPPPPEEEQVDLRDVDKPKNTIVRLPKYIVQEKKPPVFRERDVYTPKGLADIAMRRYSTEADRALNRWTIPYIGMTKEARALAMYEEDERLRNMSDLREAGLNAGRTDPAAGDYILRESRKTYLRSSDFGWSSGEPR